MIKARNISERLLSLGKQDEGLVSLEDVAVLFDQLDQRFPNRVLFYSNGEDLPISKEDVLKRLSNLTSKEVVSIDTLMFLAKATLGDDNSRDGAFLASVDGLDSDGNFMLSVNDLL